MGFPKAASTSRSFHVASESIPVLLLHNLDPSWSPEELQDAKEQVALLMESLRAEGHPVGEQRVTDSLLAMRLAKWDPAKLVVLNWCEAIPGLERSEPLVALALEALGFTYTGSPAEVLSLSWDKRSVKRILSKARILTPRWKAYLTPTCHDWRTFPAIVKPALEHCSLGLSPRSVVMDTRELAEQIERVLDEMKQPAMVEDFIDGPEFHVNLWGNGMVQVLPPAEMDFSSFQDPRDRLCTFDSKFTPGSLHYEGIRVKVPSSLGSSRLKSLEKIALKTYRAVGCRDYARLDLRLRGDQFYVLDVNPNPDISSDTSLALCAEHAGYSYGSMLSHLVKLAAERHPVLGKALGEVEKDSVTGSHQWISQGASLLV
jgi:D-alanine-D-alanine ligase